MSSPHPSVSVSSGTTVAAGPVPTRVPLRRRRWFRITLGSLLTAVFFTIIAVLVCWYLVVRGTLIDVARFARPDDSLVVLDRTGTPLRHVRVDGMDRRWVPLRDISPQVVSAFIAAEDADFFAHRGVDGRAVMRSLFRNLLPWGRKTGASTITQQLVKRVYGRQSLWDKPVEALRALTLERVFTKDEILEQYLNRVPFGDNIEGVARACEEYFGHSIATASLSEAALLAGVPQAPSITEPRRHFARAIARRAFVLARMRDHGVITSDDFARAIDEVPHVVDLPSRPYSAARFVDRSLVEHHEGRLQSHGGAITTSLDARLQREIEQVLAGTVDQFASRGATNGAAVVVAVSTGEILGYVGAVRGSADDPGGQIDLLEAPRQPGSTLKPFVYELLFEQGGSPATVVDDIAVNTMRGANGAMFEARDYDGKERGPVRARVALPASLNLAALDAARRVGQDRLVSRFSSLGLRGLQDASHYGAAVVLGGADVRPVDLARAYVTLARGGTSIPLSRAVVDSALPGVKVMDPASAAMTWDVLRDRRARSDAFGRDLVFEAGGHEFALKTGTSSMWHDAWTAIATEHVVVVVWLGDPSGRPMREVSGFEAAAPCAARMLPFAEAAFTRLHLPGLQNLHLPDPTEHFVDVEVCALTGLRVGIHCAHTVHENMPKDRIPSAVCDAHDPTGHGALPERYRGWIERTGPAGMSVQSTTLHSTDAMPVITSPRNGMRLLVEPSRGSVLLPLRATVDGVETSQLEWVIDQHPVVGGSWRAMPGTHTVEVIWQGRHSRVASITVTLP